MASHLMARQGRTAEVGHTWGCFRTTDPISSSERPRAARKSTRTCICSGERVRTGGCLYINHDPEGERPRGGRGEGGVRHRRTPRG